MRKLFDRFGKLELTATFLLFFMFAMASAIPVQSNTKEIAVPVDFDSVGSMLRDMDREQSMDSLSQYAGLTVPNTLENGTSCSHEGVDDRLAELRNSLDTQLNYSDIVHSFEHEHDASLHQLRELSTASDEALKEYMLERERVETRLSARERFAAMALIMQARAEEDIAMGDDKLAAKVEAALKAAEAALTKTP